MLYIDTVIWLCVGIHLLIYGLPLVLQVTPLVVTLGAICALIAGVIITIRIVLGWIMGAPKTPQAP